MKEGHDRGRKGRYGALYRSSPATFLKPLYEEEKRPPRLLWAMGQMVPGVVVAERLETTESKRGMGPSQASIMSLPPLYCGGRQLRRPWVRTGVRRGHRRRKGKIIHNIIYHRWEEVITPQWQKSITTGRSTFITMITTTKREAWRWQRTPTHGGWTDWKYSIVGLCTHLTYKWTD